MEIGHTERSLHDGLRPHAGLSLRLLNDMAYGAYECGNAAAAVGQGDYDIWRSSFGSATDLRADANYDRVVDAADYVLWRKHLGSTTAPFADGDLNGIVDAGDFAVWSANFGNVLPASGVGSDSSLAAPAGVHAVPEPSAAMFWLVALGCWLMVASCGRRRRYTGGG
jgi:hypothetical protein